MVPLQQFSRVTFAGVSAAVADIITLPPAAVDAIVGDPTDAYAGYQLNADGGVYTAAGSVLSYEYDRVWITPTSNAGDYECRASVSVGTLTSGTTGSWLPLTSTRSWHIVRTSAGTKFTQMTVEIREAALPNSVKATATISLTAEAS